MRQSEARWREPRFSRFETNGPVPTTLSADYDGAILLHEVSKTRLQTLPAFLNITADVLSVMVRFWWVGVLLLVWLVWSVVRWWQRRRNMTVK